MFNRFFTKKRTNIDAGPQSNFNVRWHEDGGEVPNVTRQNFHDLGSLDIERALYLQQLDEEGFLIELAESRLLPWESLYKLLEDEAHESSYHLLDLPTLSEIRPILTSKGSLADQGFSISIAGWQDENGQILSGARREGAILHHAKGCNLLSLSAWQVVSEVRTLARQQKVEPGERTNQLGWARVRKAALNSRAAMDSFLDRTVVLRPEQVELTLLKAPNNETNVIEVRPTFEGAPDGWLESFDRLQDVQDVYRIPGAKGGITHIVIPPETRELLTKVRRLPGRRVAGDKALQFIDNPYPYLGENATSVLPPESFEQAREKAGIYFHRFRLLPQMDETDRIESVDVEFEEISSRATPPTRIHLKHPRDLLKLADELKEKQQSGLMVGFWQGYEIDLKDFGEIDLAEVMALYERWQQEASGIDPEHILQSTYYGKRVMGLGKATRPNSPFLSKGKSEDWLDGVPMDTTELPKQEEKRTNKETLRERIRTLKQKLDEAKASGQDQVDMKLGATPVSLQDAERELARLEENLQQSDEQPHQINTADKPSGRISLLIEDNVEQAGFVQTRSRMLEMPAGLSPRLPSSLRQGVELREHQRQGVAWLQHLLEASPAHCGGALLADDMGLGKTVQILTFVARYLEETGTEAEPVLIVAPVSLLDNWAMEMEKFLQPGFSKVLKLYGNALSAVKLRKQEVPLKLSEQGITNLLRTDWRQDCQIVLTTYETLRDQEISLGQLRWSIMVCDEAQKIKNPAALVTRSAKAMNVRFKVACTGTPVENSLTDLWCLFDFFQPGLLGALNEFGKHYRRPIEAESERDLAALEELRSLIDPQILRRTKADVAKDLPAKIIDMECKSLPMHSRQHDLYLDSVNRYKQACTTPNGQGNMMILSLLARMRMICAHPAYLLQETDQIAVSPKLRWLLKSLDHIRDRGEKVIVFTELREIQRMLQQAFLARFGIYVTVVNGDTSTSSEKGTSRQKLIDAFQAQPGFGIIILSTTAVGFGVNVQAANHVVHFTRPWNPAKEDQATDRAYRIGQTKNVIVYYPTVTCGGFSSFEERLDQLLESKRALASDMLNGCENIDIMQLALPHHNSDIPRIS